MIAAALSALLTLAPAQLDGATFRADFAPRLESFSLREWASDPANGFLMAKFSGAPTPGDGPVMGGNLSDATQDQAVAGYQEACRSILDEVGRRLRRGLGPVWRVATPLPGSHDIRLDVTGPVDDADRRSATLRKAVIALNDAVVLERQARALPDGPERRDVEAKASVASAEAEEAMKAVRVETAILTIDDAEGKEVARALKSALPWATFVSVGGDHIMATGTAEELTAARDLAKALDAVARDQARRRQRDAERREADTPAARLLARPISIDFGGGALADYLGQLGERAGATSWVFSDPAVATARIPPVRLTGVTVDSALRLLDGLACPIGGNASATVAPLTVTRIDPTAIGAGAPPIYRIGAPLPAAEPESGARTSKSRDRIVTEVFDFGIAVDPKDPESEAAARRAQEALLAAIETGVGLVGAGSHFNVKLHPPSGMLFVSGDPDEVALVDKIVRQWQSRP